MKRLTKEQILDANDLRTEEVEVPEWGGTITVRTLTGVERDQLEASVIGSTGEKNLANLRAKLVTLSVSDEEGRRLFTMDEAAKLGDRAARAVDRVVAGAQRLSGFSKQDVEDLKLNLSEGRSDDSTSD